MPEFKKTAEFLVITRAGRNSLHNHWLSGASPLFDLIVIAYEDGVKCVDNLNTRHVLIPGTKVAGYNKFFLSNMGLIETYKYVALIDDDIMVNANELNECFVIGRDNDLCMWQPSLSHDSYFSYAVFLQNKKFTLRYTNFIEMQMPFFELSALKRAIFLYSMGFETGIDLIWCRLRSAPLMRYAIIDTVVVTHTRPIGTTKEQNGFGKDESYGSQIPNVLERFDVDFKGPVIYAGIYLSGAICFSRLKIMISSVTVLLSVRKAKSRYFFLKSVTDHLRHTLTRPINLSKVQPPKELIA